MVFDVSGALIGRLEFGVELAEDLLEWFSADVCEHVEAPSMGHANNEAVHAVVAGVVDDLLHAGDEDLTTLEAETLL